jgi:hypothetical protein
MLTVLWVGTVEKLWFDSLWGRFFTSQTSPDCNFNIIHPAVNAIYIGNY